MEKNTSKNLYAVGCYSPEDWIYIHEVLTRDGTLEDNIPCDCIECSDLKEHSPTRAVYLLSDEEAQELRKHPKVKFVHINYANYPNQFKAPPEDLRCSSPKYYRYSEESKHYRNWYETNQLIGTPTKASLNRSGYQLLRCTQKNDPWYNGLETGSSQIINNKIEYYGDGSDVDVIVGDEGCWIGHVEFQSNTGNGPINYIGGNKLKAGFSTSATSGTCDVLDLVLDGPYYIDPEWFESDPENRLTLRWDGTTVPVESVARSWWADTSQRSVGFSTIGYVVINEEYTRDSHLGSNNVRPYNGTSHGTQCAALTFGRTQGWAFNANKWVINVYGINGTDIEQYFDIMKLFHLYKPINPIYNTKDPTISSNSWGYRSISHRQEAILSPGCYYFYRQGFSGGVGVPYTATISYSTALTGGTIPKFMRYVGYYGDGLRMKGEHLENAYTTAGKELIDVGVIFIVAAGNSNQKQVGSSHPDFNNYWSTTQQGDSADLTDAIHSEFGIEAYNTTNRRGFPQQIGKFNDPETGEVIYPAINVGALDDQYDFYGKEIKVNYSDMGEEIDCYAPADGTLTAVNSTSIFLTKRYDIYSPTDVTTFYDTKFSGTSAACPVACGLIATKLQYNRNWTWKDVRHWLVNFVGTADTNQFYTGVESISANDENWADVESLEGGNPFIIWDSLTDVTEELVLRGSGLKFSGIRVLYKT